MPAPDADRPLSFLFVAKRLGGGGMTRSLVDTAAELVDLGHRVAVHTIAGDDIARFTPDLERGGVAVETLDRLTTPGLRDAARRHHADALRLFTGTFPPNTTVNRRLLRLGLPIVESIHAMAVRAVRPQHRLFYRYALRPCPRYRAAVLSRPMLDESIARLPALRGRFVHLPFGMRIPEPGRTPVADGLIRLVTIARLLEIHKDTTTLLRALARVATHRDGWSLTVVGAGKHADRLRTITRELALADRVEFVGYQDDPFPFLRRADIFILSTRAESFGRVNVEAAAVGVPVIASDVLGCRESVDDGVNGVLVPPGDPDALASAILDLIDDPDRRARLGAAGPDHAQRFTPRAHARAFVALARELGAGA